MKLNLIVAISKNKCIGYNNKLPWFNKADLNHFAKTTIYNKNNAVIMGSNTFKSLDYKPLRYRKNFVLTKKPFIYNTNENLKFFNNSQKIIDYCKKKNYDEAWIIGGEQIYSHFIENHKLDKAVITVIGETCKECDTYANFLSNINLNIYNITKINNGNILYCDII
jgi:dihydrofolate reductase